MDEGKKSRIGREGTERKEVSMLRGIKGSGAWLHHSFASSVLNEPI